jgi:hypothetical protein
MADLQTTIKTLVTDLIARSESFTALDVSNEVKKQFPAARHREISPIVRDLYNNGEMGLYERTQIQVSTANGPENAYLYHPVEDTWDLDTKYDGQKRAQSATIPQTPVVAPTEQKDEYGKLFGAVVADTLPTSTTPTSEQLRAEMAALSAEEKKDTPIVAAPLPPEVKAAMEEVKVMRAQQKKEAEELPPSIWSTLFSFGRKKR